MNSHAHGLRLGLLLAPLLLAACSQTPPHAGQPTEQAQAMQHMLADINQVRAYVYGSGTRADALTSAQDLVSWSGRMAELFPPDQASTEYVDMSPARAAGAPAAMTTAASQLLTTVQTGSQTAIADQLAQTEKNGCGYCHQNIPR